MTLLLRIFIFLLAVLIMSGASAEYYIVYSAPTCGFECFERPHRVTTHHKYKKHVKKHKTYKPKYVHKRQYYKECRTAPYYAWYPIASTGCAVWAAGGCGNASAWAPVKPDYSKDHTFTTPADNAYYYNYDPDLSTGDDDATVYPDMQINN